MPNTKILFTIFDIKLNSRLYQLCPLQPAQASQNSKIYCRSSSRKPPAISVLSFNHSCNYIFAYCQATLKYASESVRCLIIYWFHLSVTWFEHSLNGCTVPCTFPLLLFTAVLKSRPINKKRFPIARGSSGLKICYVTFLPGHYD